jgi:hypothetical protein
MVIFYECKMREKIKQILIEENSAVVKLRKTVLHKLVFLNPLWLCLRGIFPTNFIIDESQQLVLSRFQIIKRDYLINNEWHE